MGDQGRMRYLLSSGISESREVVMNYSLGEEDKGKIKVFVEEMNGLYIWQVWMEEE